MKTDQLKELLLKVSGGEIQPEIALDQLKLLPFKELGYACADTHRELRQGFPEAIFAEGKTVDQILEIAKSLLSTCEGVLATRVSAEQAVELQKSEPDCTYFESARVLRLGEPLRSEEYKRVKVAVVSAGTSDLSAAEEARVVLEFAGVNVARIDDVGVAGIHRLLDKIDTICDSDVVIVVAGMDGALPSVIGGIVACPLVAVPTSIGYGASFEGIAPLLTMLNSCAAGITVVNIDNGYGAAMAALRLATALTAKNS